MNNNDIFKKLRIAFDMKDIDIMETLKLADFEVTKSELNALFRSNNHRNFKPCGDQLLRKFLEGIIIREKNNRK